MIIAYLDLFMWSLIMCISIMVLMSFAWHDGYNKGSQDEVERKMDEEGI